MKTTSRLKEIVSAYEKGVILKELENHDWCASHVTKLFGVHHRNTILM